MPTHLHPKDCYQRDQSTLAWHPERGAGLVVGILIGALLTSVVGIGAILSFGVERVASELDPVVSDIRDRVAAGVVPPSARPAPKSEGDRILDAIGRVSGASVLIYRTNTENATSTFIGRGLLVQTDGLILTDPALLTDGTGYEVTVPGIRDSFPASIRPSANPALGTLTIDIASSQVARLSDTLPTDPGLIGAISGETNQRIATGIVTAIEAGYIDTNLVGVMVPGAVLVAQDGTAIGLSTAAVESETGTSVSFVPLTKDTLATLLAE